MIKEYEEIWNFIISIIRSYNEQYKVTFSEMFNDDFCAVEMVTNKKLPDKIFKKLKRLLLQTHNHVIIGIESVEGINLEETTLIVYLKTETEIRKNKLDRIQSKFHV